MELENAATLTLRRSSGWCADGRAHPQQTRTGARHARFSLVGTGREAGDLPVCAATTVGVVNSGCAVKFERVASLASRARPSNRGGGSVGGVIVEIALAYAGVLKAPPPASSRNAGPHRVTASAEPIRRRNGPSVRATWPRPSQAATMSGEVISGPTSRAEHVESRFPPWSPRLRIMAFIQQFRRDDRIGRRVSPRRA